MKSPDPETEGGRPRARSEQTPHWALKNQVDSPGEEKERRKRAPGTR